VVHPMITSPFTYIILKEETQFFHRGYLIKYNGTFNLLIQH
jgi:hypothetical protein